MARFCTECGESTDETWKVCPACGSRLPDLSLTPSSAAPDALGLSQGASSIGTGSVLSASGDALSRESATINGLASLTWPTRVVVSVLVFHAALSAALFVVLANLATAVQSGSVTGVGPAVRTYEAVNGLRLLVLLLGAIVFAVWQYRAQRNVRVAVPGTQKPWRVLILWVIPLVNLVGPYRAVRELAKASGRPPDGDWTGVQPPRVLGWWWGTLIAGGFVGRLASVQYETSTFGSAAGTESVSILLHLIAAILAILLVRDIGQRQRIALHKPVDQDMSAILSSRRAWGDVSERS